MALILIMINKGRGFLTMVGHKKKFKKQILASVISSMTMAAVGTQAQDSLEEEVIVTGIRNSLQSSMNVKRDSVGVVDAITAEDIGKFPDSNLAESLQRITGVSISRRNGEGSQVTVRGFGPEFNMVTLNGRIMPATSLVLNGGGDSSSRAFDMDNIASEGVSGVEVYKTSKANIVSGGIGATINLKTHRPLENPGFKLSVGAKALQDETNEAGDDVTPELSGLISWSDENEMFGVSLSASYQERHSGASGAFVSQWSGNQAYTGVYPLTVTDDQFLGGVTEIENEPAIGEVVGNPSDLRYFHADRERERTNAQLTLQFAPNENLTGTLDYTFAEQVIYENRSELSAWFQDFRRTDLVFDDSASPTPVLYWEESRDRAPTVDDDGIVLPRDIGLALQQQNQINELESIGLNLEWQASEGLVLNFDVHDSTSESLPNADYGNWINTGLGAQVSDAQGADWTGDLPVILIDFDDEQRSALNGNGVLDAADVGSAVRQLNRNTSVTDITQIKIDGKFEFSDEASIDFGIESRSMENVGRTAFDQTLLEGGWGIQSPGDVPAEFLEPINYANLFDGYSTNSSNQAWFDGVSGGEAAPLTQGFTGDAAVIGRYLAENRRVYDEDLDAYVAAPIPFSTADLVDTTNRIVEEDIDAIYFQVNLESSLGDMPVSIVAGLRYESTDVSSNATVAIPNVRWEANNDFSVLGGDASNPETYEQSASYSHLLPSLDISIDVHDDVVARFSYGSTIARASYSDLSASEAATVNGGPSLPTLIAGSTPGTASLGNPSVLPLASDNFDMSVEWYFDDTSYASIGYFDKRVSNFIGTSPVDDNVYGIRDPSAGPRASAAVAALEAAGIAVDATSLFSMMAALEEGAEFGSRTSEEWENLYDFLGEADDPLMIFTTQVPSNINDARIEGIEIAAQHFFGESGFGMQANYTFVSGDVDFDVTADPAADAQFALTGLSDTANLSLIYENHGFSGRISYNWRDKFLDNTAVTGNEPQFTEAYSQVDFNLSYEIMEGLFASLEGINITEEDQRQYGRSERQLTRLEILGARYALGIRYTF